MPDQQPEPSATARIDELQHQIELDRKVIAGLEQQGVVDREIIGALLDQGSLDRAEIANLHDALVTARRIGAAMGILMSSRKLSQEAAFDLLREHSQHNHRKLRDIADQVLYTGTLDD